MKRMKTIYLLFLITITLSNTFDNVQVLDIETRSEMKKYMKSISKDLGVKCSYCHDMENKALDNPHKEITREMIILTRTINRHLLSLKDDDEKDTVELVTCWTCHKGNTKVEYNKPEDD